MRVDCCRFRLLSIGGGERSWISDGFFPYGGRRGELVELIEGSFLRPRFDAGDDRGFHGFLVLFGVGVNRWLLGLPYYSATVSSRLVSGSIGPIRASKLLISLIK